MMPVTGAALNPPGWEMNNNSLNALAYCRQCPLFPFTEMRGRLLREARIPCSLLTSLGTDTMPGTFLPAGLCGYRDSQPAGCFILPILSQSPGELGHQSPPGASTCLGTQTRRDGLRHLEKLPTLPHVNEHSQHILVHAQSSVHACGRCRPPQVCGVQPHIPCTGQRVPRADRRLSWGLGEGRTRSLSGSSAGPLRGSARRPTHLCACWAQGTACGSRVHDTSAGKCGSFSPRVLYLEQFACGVYCSLQGCCWGSGFFLTKIKDVTTAMGGARCKRCCLPVSQHG